MWKTYRVDDFAPTSLNDIENTQTEYKKIN